MVGKRSSEQNGFVGSSGSRGAKDKDRKTYPSVRMICERTSEERQKGVS